MSDETRTVESVPGPSIPTSLLYDPGYLVV